MRSGGTTGPYAPLRPSTHTACPAPTEADTRLNAHAQVVTSDGLPACQFEHMIICTEDGPDVVTRTPTSLCLHDQDYKDHAAAAAEAGAV